MKKSKQAIEKQVVHKPKKGSRRIIRNTIRVVGWMVIIGSISFGVYKNFTAIDKNTVVKENTVIEKVYNTSGIEEFTKNFAYTYFALSPKNDDMNKRMEKLENYMQSDLIQINQGETDSDKLKEKVSVEAVKVWNVEPIEDADHNFVVHFSLTQVAGKVKKTHTYRVELHAEDDSYVIIKNPTITSDIKKAAYEKEHLKSDDMIKAQETKGVKEFLETFFKVYPEATVKELSYYVKDESIKPIENGFEFVSMDNLQIKHGEEIYQVGCFVKYYEKDTKITSLHQYELVLATQEDGKFVITEMK